MTDCSANERFERLKAEACRASVRGLVASISAQPRAASPAAWTPAAPIPDSLPAPVPKRARLEPSPPAEAEAVRRLPSPVDEPLLTARSTAPVVAASPTAPVAAAPPAAARTPPFTFASELLPRHARAVCPLPSSSDEAAAWLALATAPHAPLTLAELLHRFAGFVVVRSSYSTSLPERLSAAISHGAPYLLRLRSSNSDGTGWLYGARSAAASAPLPPRRAGTATLGAPPSPPLACPATISFRDGTLRKEMWSVLARSGASGLPLSALAAAIREKGFSCSPAEVEGLLESSRQDGDGVFGGSGAPHPPSTRLRLPPPPTRPRSPRHRRRV